MAKTFQIHGIEVAGMKPFTCMRLQLLDIRPHLQSRALSVDVSYEGGIVHIENKKFHLSIFKDRVFSENLESTGLTLDFHSGLTRSAVYIHNRLTLQQFQPRFQ
jgi:hypothetical protein